MTYTITADNTADNFMSELIKHKYAKNIDYLIDRVKVTPKNYKEASTLHKRWVVYFRYQTTYSDKPKKFERTSYTVNGLDIDINRIKDHKEKIKQINFLKNSIVYQLKNDIRFVLVLLYGKSEAEKKYPSAFKSISEHVEKPSIETALSEVMKTKKGLSNTYYNDLNSVKNRFLEYIGVNRYDTTDLISKNNLVAFLNEVTKNSKPRTYNNIKTNLKTLVEGLKDLDYIEKNYLDGIKNKQTKAKRNIAFSIEQRDLIFREAKKKDLSLYYFLLHVYYELMRPQTVVRLKVKDVDLKNMVFDTDTKTGNYIKLILKPVYNEFYKNLDLRKAKPDDYIFSGKGFLGSWEAKDENRRQSFTERFKEHIKDHYFENKEYTIYSLRHTAIGVAFKNKAKELKDQNIYNYNIEAVKWVQQFTEHKTVEETKIYLRGVSFDILEDWSEYL